MASATPLHRPIPGFQTPRSRVGAVLPSTILMAQQQRLEHMNPALPHSVNTSFSWQQIDEEDAELNRLAALSPITVGSGTWRPSPITTRPSVSPFAFVPIQIIEEKLPPTPLTSPVSWMKSSQNEDDELRAINNFVQSPAIRKHVLSPADTLETYDVLTIDNDSTTYLYSHLSARPSSSMSVSCATKSPIASRVLRDRPMSAPTICRKIVKDDQESSTRKSRVKTELCMHYENGRACPFGINCTYAHGEEELQLTKIMDLHEAGLIDMDTYRTKPCLTWIKTGSCPFGKRCTGIHDPRVASWGSSGEPLQSWLPHTETQGNTISTDINVESLHQKRLHTVLYGSPFGELLHIDPVSTKLPGMACSFEDLYKIVCGEINDPQRQEGWSTSNGRRKGPRTSVHPIYRLQIALKLRGTDSDWHYKYRPQHIVHDELCMVLQKRAFRVVSNVHGGNHNRHLRENSANATATSSVVEIPLSAYHPNLSSHILAHEIAFGPDSDPTVRGVALWFNIDEDDVKICTPQQAKRFRWKGGEKPRVNNTNNSTDTFKTKQSIFDSGVLESFPMIRPHDCAAFKLTTAMLQHRLACLKRDRMSNMKERFEHLQKLELQKTFLKTRFENQRRDWIDWTWPINKDRLHVDHDTPTPPADVLYEMAESSKANGLKVKEDGDGFYLPSTIFEEHQELDDSAIQSCGKHVRRIWKSFVEISLQNNPVHSNRNKTPELQPVSVAPGHRRLPIFEQLALGIPVAQSRALPHIKHNSIQAHTIAGKTKQLNPNRQQERCWKALLLPANSSNHRNEWDLVHEHFMNSRSKKVLTILQQ